MEVGNRRLVILRNHLTSVEEGSNGAGLKREDCAATHTLNFARCAEAHRVSSAVDQRLAGLTQQALRYAAKTLKQLEAPSAGGVVFFDEQHPSAVAEFSDAHSSAPQFAHPAPGSDKERGPWRKALGLGQAVSAVQTLPPALSLSPWAPQVDLRESEFGYVLAVALPGLQADQVRVALRGRQLTVRSACSKPSARHSFARAGLPVFKDHSFTDGAAMEQSMVYMQWTLPADAEAAGASAELRNGILQVRISKRKN